MSANYYEDEDDSGATTHYAQLDVPGYTLANPAKCDGDYTFVDSSGKAVATTGNSFIRLGASPVTVTYANSKFSMSTDSTAPTGFDTSLTLAKIVGNMDSGSDGKTDTVATAEDTTDTAKSSGYYTEDPFQGDSLSLLGFADDTRVRDDAANTVLYIDGAKRTNSPENRRTETYRLLSKGGWWDHSDGNRISTTVGDKIEVIQGNYKLVVLGRRDPADVREDETDATDTETGTKTDTKTVDISGGYEFSKKYEYLSTEEVWSSWEKSSEINATKVSSGKEISYFKGSERRTYIGKHPDDTEERPDIWTKTWANNSETRTWAKTIETYTGSADEPVNHSLALTYAELMEDVRFGYTMQDVRFFVEHLTARSAGTVISWNLGANITTFNAAPVVWKIDIAPQTFETKLGIDWKIATKKTGVWLHDQDMTVKKDMLAAAVTELKTYAAHVAATSVYVGSTRTHLLNNLTTLSNLATSMAALHNWG